MAKKIKTLKYRDGIGNIFCAKISEQDLKKYLEKNKGYSQVIDKKPANILPPANAKINKKLNE